MAKPIEITLYDPETNEPIKTFVRSYVPWAVLKQALRLQKSITKGEVSDELMDELAGLVVAAFGDQFSLEQATNGMDSTEMMVAMEAIIGRATQFLGNGPANPTRAA